ncbi:MAG: cytochrome P450, partial [Pseudomonadota bacterium]
MNKLPPYLKLDRSKPAVSIDPRHMAFVQNPYAAYAALFEVGCPVFYWEEYGIWCFAGFDAVNALFRDRRFGRQILHVATREELGWPPRPKHLKNFDEVEQYSLLELEPPGHTRLRKLVNRAFVSRQVELLRPQIEALCNQLLDTQSGEIELLAEYATPLPLTTICRLLGVPIEAGPQLLEWSHAIVKMYVLDPTMEDQLAADAASAEFAAFLRTHIRSHRQTPRDDLLSTLIAASEDGDTLSEDELISTIVVLLNAGHEATVHQLGNAVQSILDSGLDPTLLFESSAATIATVEECLRIDPPLHMFTRYCLEDLTLELDGAAIE